MGPISPPKNIIYSIIIELELVILYQPLYHFKMVVTGVVRIHMYTQLNILIFASIV